LAALSIISPKVGGVFVVVSVAAADIVDKYCLRDGSSFWAGLYVVAMTENQEEARAKGFDYFSQPRHQSKHTLRERAAIMTISKTVQIEKKTKQESDEKASDVTQKEPQPRVWMVRIFCIVNQVSLFQLLHTVATPS
jgi:hypothetical protein